MKKGPGLPGPFYFLAEEAVLGLLTAIPANPLAAAALGELLSRRRSCERH